MKTEEIITERLILRKLTQETFDYIFKEKSDDDLMVFLGLNSKEELHIEQNKYKEGFSTHNKKFLYFQLLVKDTRKIIGWCGYHTWYIDHNRAEIGYGLSDEDYKNKGLMTEAIITIIDYEFKTMKLNRIEAFISPDNIPSLKLIQKMNFVKEGHLRQHYNEANRLDDSVVFALLFNEYQ